LNVTFRGDLSWFVGWRGGRFGVTEIFLGSDIECHRTSLFYREGCEIDDFLFSIVTWR
jgi:hypothetical protein